MNRAERRKFERELAKRQSNQKKREQITIGRTTADLQAIMQQYSFEDIWRYLFVCDLWLPNIGAYAKHQFLACLLLSMPSSLYKPESQIKSYEDFHLLFRKITPLLPSFPMIEDYSPEADWGEVKYFFEGKIYPLLYGCELSALPDYISSFDLMYSPFDDQYLETVGRSPRKELKAVLNIHNHLIENIRTQPPIEAIGQVVPGSVELPSTAFWVELNSYIDNGLFETVVDRDFFDVHCLKFSLQKITSALNNFPEGVMLGTNIPSMFIKMNEKYFPILPRRFVPILIDTWGEIYKEVGSKFRSSGMPYSMGISGEIQKYLSVRINENDLFSLVNAVDGEGQHHEIVFAAALQARNKLLLIYISDPVISSSQWSASLQEFLPKIREAVLKIAGPPIRMHLNLESKILEARRTEENESVVVLPFIVIPQTKIVMETVIPEDLRHLFFSLEQFVGLIDEANDMDEVSDFLDFLFEYGDMLSMSNRIAPMDKMFEFRESNSVLVPGVQQPSIYIGNPHGGSHLRYKSLSNFWQAFPVGAWGDPRAWRINKADKERVTLSSRSLRILALAAQAGTSSCLISFPLEDADFEQAQLCDFVGQIIQDTLVRNEDLIKNLKCLNKFKKIQILIFPKSVTEREQFKHLRHMASFDGIWAMDVGWPASEEPGVRIIFDEERLLAEFENVEDAKLEILLLQQLLLVINSLDPDEYIDAVIEHLDRKKSSSRRFSLNLERQIPITPRVISIYIPELADYKYARKRVASMAETLGLPTGEYAPSEALAILNQLRDISIRDINDHIQLLSFEKSIPILIKQMEGIRQKEEFARQRARMTKNQQVDYDVASHSLESYQEFITHHRNLRYLIEKLVQLRPTGNLVLTPDKYKYVIAQIDWLQTIYQASDAIHYDIEPPSISFGEDYVISFHNTFDFENKTLEFGKHEENLKLGLIGNDDDRIKKGRPGTDIVKDLNFAMSEDFGFSYEDMVYVATALAQWPHFNKSEPAAIYSECLNKVKETIHKGLPDISQKNIEKVIDFLTLKTDQMLLILESESMAEDLPIWEHAKRPARYNLRPILTHKDKLFWGAHSVWESMNLWANSFLSGGSPITIRTPKMNSLIASRKKVFEDLLEEKAFEIVKRYTAYAQINLELYKKFKQKGFPQEIGEFDGLAYFPDQRTIVSIEAKHIREAFCAKDARRLREKIFGTAGKSEGYIGKTERRHSYLENNWQSVCSALEWPVVGVNEVNIVTLYVAQRSYWWTMFPPIKCKTEFTVLELLDEKIRSLLANNA